jgi:type I restriction enzyme S subunit
MEEFKTYLMEDLIEEIAMGPFGSNIKVDCFVDSGVPVLNGANLQGFKLREDSFNYVTTEKADSLNKANAYRGDIVITHRGTLGQIVYIPNDSKYERYVISQSQFRVRVNPEVALPEYVVFYFHTRIGQHRLLANASQVGVPAIARPSTTFKKVEIELPSLNEQKRIVGILNSLSDKIDLNNRINHNLEEQIQYRFDCMIMSENGLGYCQIADYVDVNPKRSLGKNVFAKCIDMSFLSTTGPFPSGWETKGYNGGMKFLNGDTIMARITPCLENGKVAFVNFLEDGEVAFGSTEYIVLHAKDGVAPVFTYFLARNKDFVDYATKNMNGSSGRQRVSGDTIEKYKIPVIDSDSLNEFSRFAAPAMEVIRNNSFENRSLASTRDALLPLLLSGNLSITQMNC